MGPTRKLLLLVTLFAIGLLCRRIFEFDQPILNYCFSLLVAYLPFLAVKPLLKLSKWSKRIGLVFLGPLLFIDMVLVLVFFACGSPEVHHNLADSCIHEKQTLEHSGFSVVMWENCGGGATVNVSQWIEQRLRIAPGFYLVRTVDSFYGSASGSMTFVNGNTLKYTRQLGDTSEGTYEHFYTLKPHVYF